MIGEIEVPACRKCCDPLVFDDGYPDSRWEPGQPATVYCGNVNCDLFADELEEGEREDVDAYWEVLSAASYYDPSDTPVAPVEGI